MGGKINWRIVAITDAAIVPQTTLGSSMSMSVLISDMWLNSGTCFSFKCSVLSFLFLYLVNFTRKNVVDNEKKKT